MKQTLSIIATLLCLQVSAQQFPDRYYTPIKSPFAWDWGRFQKGLVLPGDMTSAADTGSLVFKNNKFYGRKIVGGVVTWVPFADSTSAGKAIITRQTISERDSIPDEDRYEGLIAYVSDSLKYYSLVGGILNTDWEEFNSSGPPGPPGIISVQTIVERNAIPNDQRYEGLFSYVGDSLKYYSLIGGIANINWTEFAGDLPPWVTDTLNNHSSEISALKDSVNKVDSIPFDFYRDPIDPDSITMEVEGAKKSVYAPISVAPDIPDIPARQVVFGNETGNGDISFSDRLRYTDGNYLSFRRYANSPSPWYGIEFLNPTGSQRGHVAYNDTTNVLRLSTYTSSGRIQFWTNNTHRAGFDSTGQFYLLPAAIPIDLEYTPTYAIAPLSNGRMVRVPWPGGSSGGGLTSVGLSLPTSIFSVSGSPLTANGTITATLANQSAYTVLQRGAGTGVPSFAALTASHIPTLPSSKISGFEADVRAAISLTTTGSSGPATYNPATGVFNIPNYAGGGGGSPVWGNITGTMADQTDLQNALNAKQATVTGGATTITNSNLTTNRVLISNGSGKVAVSTVTAAQLAEMATAQTIDMFRTANGYLRWQMGSDTKDIAIIDSAHQVNNSNWTVADNTNAVVITNSSTVRTITVPTASAYPDREIVYRNETNHRHVVQSWGINYDSAYFSAYLEPKTWVRAKSTLINGVYTWQAIEQGVTGSPLSNQSGAWWPTINGTPSVTVNSRDSMSYIRNGNTATVGCSFTITPGTTGMQSLQIPVSSLYPTLSGSITVGGSGSCIEGSNITNAIVEENLDGIRIRFQGTASTAYTVSFSAVIRFKPD